MFRHTVFAVIGALLFSAPFAQGAELITDTQITEKATVLEVLKEEERDVPGTDTKINYQSIKVEVVDGPDKGTVLTLDNDFLKLSPGDIFFLIKTTTSEGRVYYNVSDPYRLPYIYFFAGLLVVLIIAIGGVQGIRGLVSLIGSFLLIAYILLPGILHGFSPIALAMAVASLIVIVGSYITHGLNKTTSAAVLGMIATILLTGLIAWYTTDAMKLTGFSSDEAVYLNFNARGAIDMAGLLLSGILIGLLGILYDSAIAQAIAVEELHRAAPAMTRRHVFARAMRIGREHIGALVNTLAIAYVGVSLPLLLLFYFSSAPILEIVNREVFATEITRILIGSIGLILTVPITTLIATWVIVKEREHHER